LALAVGLAGEAVVQTPDKKNPHPSQRARRMRHPKNQTRLKGWPNRLLVEKLI
jgi:hypothetical protein